MREDTIFYLFYLRFFQIFFGRPEKNGKQPENSYLCTDGNTVRQYPHPPSDRTRHRARERRDTSVGGCRRRSCDRAGAHVGPAQIVGEIGLDYLRPDREAQLRIFEGQLRLAEAAGKPVVLHCVKAFEETMRLLKQFRLRAVIFHGFIGSPEQAARAVAAGYYLSFGPRSLRSPRTVRALGSIPTQRLFLETDDAPATIESVYATAARLLGMPLDRLKETIYNNYLHIFS